MRSVCGATRAKDRDLRRCAAIAARSARALLLLALVGLLIVGCRTPEQRYHTLSFFFDGVPPPPGMVVPPEKLNPWDPALASTSAEGTPVQVVSATTQPTVQSIHYPYQKRECGKCHGSSGSFRVTVTDIVSCTSCHESHGKPTEGDWVHGPLAVTDCSFCHVPHKSEHESLLNKPQQDVCFYCHDQRQVLAEPYHELVQTVGERCGACHDPHMAGNRLLLVDADSYRNRRIAGWKPVSIHQPYKEMKCGACHIETESNRVRDDIDQACRDCHGDLIAKAGTASHQAVRDGKCVSCHHPHQSPRPHLVRTTAEEMCYACHKPQELQTPQHPPVNRADCLMCHTGHDSDRPHLLRDAPTPLDSRLPSIAAPTAPTDGDEAPPTAAGEPAKGTSS